MLPWCEAMNKELIEICKENFPGGSSEFREALISKIIDEDILKNLKQESKFIINKDFLEIEKAIRDFSKWRENIEELTPGPAHIRFDFEYGDKNETSSALFECISADGKIFNCHITLFIFAQIKGYMIPVDHISFYLEKKKMVL